MLVPIFWGCQRGLATCQCRAFSTATALQHQLLQQASQGSSEHAVQVLHPLDVPARLSNEGPATLHDRHPEGVPHSLDAQLLVSSRAAVAAATAATGAATQHAQHSAPRTQQHELQDAIKPGSVQHSSPAGLSTVSEQQAKAVGGFRTGVTTLPAGTGFKKTFYKRTLPSPPATAFASEEGRKLFAEALAAGHTNGFFKLMEQFSTQDEPAFCGLASLAMVLNALAIDPRRTWKGSWRWFHEQMLDCCRPLENVRKAGITLTHAACLSRCNGARVDLHRYGTFTLEDLRRQVIEVCSTGEDHLVVSYSRRTFGQTGDGHFSPIGGFHQGKDLVLILDVARFKYPPHWVPLSMLYEAMQYVDPVTSQPRGFLRMSAHPLQGSVLLTLDVRSAGAWRAAHAFARAGAKAVLQSHVESCIRRGSSGDGSSSLVESAVATLVQQLPLDSTNAFLVVRQQQHSPQPHQHVCSSDSTQEHTRAGHAKSSSTSSSGTTQEHTRAGHAKSSSTSSSGTTTNNSSSTGASNYNGNDGRGPAAASSSASAGGPSCEDRAAAGSGLSAAAGSSMSSLGPCTADSWEDGGLASSSERSTVGHSSSLAAIVDDSDRCVPHQARAQLLAELHATPLFQMVLEHMQRMGLGRASPLWPASGMSEPGSGPSASGGCCGSAHAHAPHQQSSACGPHATPAPEGASPGPQAACASPGYLAEKATILLLLQTPAQWGVAWPHPEAAEQWQSLMDVSAFSILDAELTFLREQWRHIADLDGMYGASYLAEGAHQGKA